MTDFGTVRRDGSFGSVRFERVYGAPPEQLWAAWTTPERLGRWLGASVHGPIEPGAEATLAWGDDPDSQVALVIKGHTDASGSNTYNQTLSEHRAAAVQEYLIKVHRTDPTRVAAQGLGEMEPLIENPYDGKNRRVEFERIR